MYSRFLLDIIRTMFHCIEMSNIESLRSAAHYKQSDDMQRRSL